MTLTPVEKRNYLKELTGSEIFKAQLQLEDEIAKDLTRRLSELDLTGPNFHLEYARLRGGIDFLKTLQGVRKQIITTA